MNFSEKLIKNTVAYKVVEGEKNKGALSHAYMMICDDKDMLAKYLKIFAKMILRDKDEVKNARISRLIDENEYADCLYFPKTGDKILTDDVEKIIAESFVKPTESDKKLFVLSNAENMNAAAQNKILKTLEEPPENVCILIGAIKDDALLPTVKSRVKRLEIPPFSDNALYAALCEEYPDESKLRFAVSASGGRAGIAIKAYTDGNLTAATELARDVLKNLNSSKDAVRYSGKIDKDNLKAFVSAMKTEIASAIRGEKSAVKTDAEIGALLAIQDMLCEKERGAAFNANVKMSVDAILFGIAKEKKRWQK